MYPAKNCVSDTKARVMVEHICVDLQGYIYCARVKQKDVFKEVGVTWVLSA